MSCYKNFLLPTLVAGCSLVLNTETARADQPPVIVVTPSKVEQPLEQVGSTIHVLDIPELTARGVRYVEQALREIPSLHVSSYGARGSQVQLRVRGNEANHVLILVDGVRVASAATGEFDLANMSLAAVERIEVLLGPQSTLYGSDAIAGVILITTRKGGTGFAGELQLDVAKRDEHAVAVNLSGGKRGFDYAVTMEDRHTDGISAAAESLGNTEADAYDLQSAQVRLGYSTDAFRLDLSLGRSEAGFDFDGFDSTTGQAVDEELNHQDDESTRQRLSLTLPGRWMHQINLSRMDHDYQSESVFFGSPSTYETQTRRSAIEYRGTLTLDDRNRLVFGLENLTEELETASNWSGFEGDVEINSLYLEWLHQAGDWGMTLGLRGDDHETFGGHSTARLTLYRALNEAWRLRAAAGSGFKAPSLQELYDSTFGANPDLEPEESESVEIGLEYRKQGYRLSLVAFDQTTDNLIRYTGVWPNARNENVGEAASRGVELSLSKDWQMLRLDLALTRTDATETDNGVTKDRLRVPEYSADAKLSIHQGAGRLWLQASYQGERRDFNWGTFSDVTLDSYTLWNLGYSVQARDDLTFSARIDNLTDRVYEEVYSYGVPDRTVRLSARWSF
jgi:vitamin B12 transporter